MKNALVIATVILSCVESWAFEMCGWLQQSKDRVIFITPSSSGSFYSFEVSADSKIEYKAEFAEEIVCVEVKEFPTGTIIIENLIP